MRAPRAVRAHARVPCALCAALSWPALPCPPLRWCALRYGAVRCAGKDAKSKARGASEIAWSQEDIFHAAGDTVLLMDPKLNVVSKVDVISR